MNDFYHREQVDVILIDFFKAFNRVDHAVLVKVQTDYGFDEPLLSKLISSSLFVNGQYCIIRITCYYS